MSLVVLFLPVFRTTLDMSVPAGNLDISREAGLYSYCLTLTCKDGFTDDQQTAMINFHQSDWFVNVMLVSEEHDSGEIHYHSLADLKVKNAGSVTRHLERFYHAQDIPWEKGVSVKVKRCTDKLGWFHYLCKEIPEDHTPLVLKGWRWTWIQEQVREGIKKMPYRMLLKDVYKVNKSNGTEIVLLYADKNKMRISGKDTYTQVILAMVRDKYRFASGSQKWIYAECMTVLGHDFAMESLIENELFHLQ